MAHTVRTIIFNKTGSAIAEIEPEYQSITWRLNGVGIAKMKMSYADSKCTPEYLASGNRILIQFESGLPDFGGVIDFPRKRTIDGVAFTAYSGERLLDWRVTEKHRYFDSQTAGLIFEGLVTAANAIRPTGITIGDVDKTGTVRTMEYHFHDLLKRVQDLAKMAGQDFYISSTYTAGKIQFYANWYERRGLDRRGLVWLIEDVNVASVVLDEQGPLATTVILIGAGQTWGSERMDSISTDADAEAAYGYREWSRVHSGVTVQSTLDANAAEVLDGMKEPKMKFSLTVLDKDPAAFGQYDVGDILTLQAMLRSGDWAYEDTVRVKGREWRPDNTCRLEVEEWDS